MVSWARCRENLETCIFHVNVCKYNGFPATKISAMHIHPFSDTYVGRIEQDSSLMGRNGRVSRHNRIVAAIPVHKKCCPNNQCAAERTAFFSPFRRRSISIALMEPWEETIKSCDGLIVRSVPIYPYRRRGGREAKFQAQIFFTSSMIRDLCTPTSMSQPAVT